MHGKESSMLMAEKYFWMTEGLVASAIASHDTTEKARYLCLHLPVNWTKSSLLSWPVADVSKTKDAFWKPYSR